MEVVTWSPGHSGLLLTSRPVDPIPPDQPFDRIEVWFKPADVVLLPVHLDGLIVDDADPEAEATITQLLGRDLSAWEKSYVIGSNNGPVGWVVGGSVSGRSDRQAFDAPTIFDGWSVAPGVTDLFTHNGS